MSGPVPPRPDVPPGRPGLDPVPWRWFEIFPVFGLYLVVAAALVAPVEAFVPSCGARFVLTALVGEVAFAIPVLFWIRVVSHARLSAVGPPQRPVRDLLAGLATGAALVVLGGIVLTVVRTLVTRSIGHPPPTAEQVASCVRGDTLYLTAPVVILVAPICEELFFRGFFYRGLRRNLSMWPATLISAAVFGAAHYAGVGFLILIPALFVVGIGLALVYERRSSILASMAAHATFNLVGFVTIALSRGR